MNLHDFVAYDKKTNAKTHSSLLFINAESDGGSSSIEETLKHIENDNHVCGFTGQTDRNGTKIYEGDVLSHPYGKCFVEFSDEYAGFVGTVRTLTGTIFLGAGTIFLGAKEKERIEVIGNRYQNPELLNTK